MGGFLGVTAKKDCVFDLFFGIDYHSHLGTRRAGMAVYDQEKGFDRAIHNIENAPIRTKFDREVNSMQGSVGIGCISDFEPQPLIVRSHHGTYAITTVGRINNTEVLVQDAFEELMKGRTSFIVAHRLSTIKNADQILVMKAGNIIERGTHEELLAQGGFYKQLYESQFAKA